MAATAKISISVADRDLLAWARRRSERTGASLSAIFTEAIRIERQMEAREAFLTSEGPEGRATPEEMEAIRAEWGARSSARRTRSAAATRSRGTAKRRR